MARRLNRLIRILVLCPLVLFVSGCAAPPDAERFEYAQIIMGVEGRITLYARDEPAAVRAATAAFARMSALEAVLSDYQPDSEAMRLASKPPGEWHPVSPDLFAALTHAQGMSVRSNGAFDVTVGPLVRLWRTARRDRRLPSPDDLAAARTQVSSVGLELDADRQAVRFRVPPRLDFGGIGKGLALDAAHATLRAHEISDCLLSLGGDLRLGGAPPDRDGWAVRVTDGHDTDAGFTVMRSDVGIAVSGDAEQYIELDGVRYAHLVDPRTGLGLTHQVSVAVVAPNGTNADALASAFSVLNGLDPEAALLRTPSIEVYRRERGRPWRRVHPSGS